MLSNLKFRITSKGVVPLQKTLEEENIKVLVATGDEHSTLTMAAPTKKRSAVTSLAGPKEKIQKIDQSVKSQCGNILKEFMTYHGGWIFNEPFDPVKWNIHDYFSIISKPMDLGTIKGKLEGNMYLSADEFADDVVLTYANALLYNPPEDHIHKLAKLNIASFNAKWKIMEATNIGVEKSCKDTKQVGVNRAPVLSNHGRDKPMLLKGRIKLQRETDTSFDAKVKPKKMVGKKSHLLRKIVQKGTTYRGGPCSSVNHKQLDTTTIICHCHDKSAPAPQAHSSGLTFESDGPGVVLNEMRHVNHSTAAPTDASGEGLTSSNLPLSFKKALRVAMLKKRYAGTIYKAAHKDDTRYSGKKQQEIEKLEIEHLEEKTIAEIENQTAEQIKQLKARAQLMKCEIERTVFDLDENFLIMTDLERLGLAYSYPSEGVKNPLKNLGLYIKEEYSLKEDEDDEEGEILEEGEIWEEGEIR